MFAVLITAISQHFPFNADFNINLTNNCNFIPNTNSLMTNSFIKTKIRTRNQNSYQYKDNLREGLK